MAGPVGGLGGWPGVGGSGKPGWGWVGPVGLAG